jgi:hypothetical protein
MRSYDTTGPYCRPLARPLACSSMRYLCRAPALPLHICLLRQLDGWSQPIAGARESISIGRHGLNVKPLVWVGVRPNQLHIMVDVLRALGLIRCGGDSVQ